MVVQEEPAAAHIKGLDQKVLKDQGHDCAYDKDSDKTRDNAEYHAQAKVGQIYFTQIRGKEFEIEAV